jgi:hypothetical protein|tara:strand:- start:1207 stop:1389 length:183 start_codon:yes stop_codon:yes gene_type:complete
MKVDDLDVHRIVQLLVSIVGLFAVIATFTPNTSDNDIVNVLLKIVNVLGANIGEASNKEL